MFTLTSGKRPKIKAGISLTKQSMRDECNANFIMEKYKRTGVLNFSAARQAEYMECPAMDFQEAMDAVRQAEETFDAMPSHLRKKFANDPGQFIDFVHNPDNAQELYDLGLSNKNPKKELSAPEEPSKPPKSKKATPDPVEE